MTGTYAQDWKPSNLGGEIYYDPRRELEYWAASVHEGQPMVAVPVATLRAAAAVRVCRATTVLTGDEDGPLLTPQTLHCNRIERHLGQHGNGYLNWGQR